MSLLWMIWMKPRVRVRERKDAKAQGRKEVKFSAFHFISNPLRPCVFALPLPLP